MEEGVDGREIGQAKGPKAHQASQREEDSETRWGQKEGAPRKQLRADGQVIKLQRDK